MPVTGVPFLDTLTKGARTAYPVIRALVAAGQSGQEVYESLQAAGLGARKTDVLAIVRNESDAILTRSDISRYLQDTVPDLSRIREAATKIVAPYSYTLEVTLLDPDTGEEEVVLRQGHSQDLLSPAEAANNFMDTNAEGNLYNGQEVSDVRTVDIVRSGSQGVL